MEFKPRVDIGTGTNVGNNASSNVPLNFLKRFSHENRESAGNDEDFNLERDNSKIVKLLDSVIKFSIFAVFFGLPLFFTGLTFQGITFEKQLYFYFWILVALVAWGSKSGYVGEMKIRRTPLDLPILAFWVFYLIATIFSIDRWHSFFGFFGDPSRGFISVTAMIVFYYLVLSNLNENLLKWVTRAIISSGTIVLIWEILKIFKLRLFFPEAFWNIIPVDSVGSLQSAAIFACFMAIIFLMSVLRIQANENITFQKRTVYTILSSVMLAVSLFLILALYNYLPIFSRFPLIGLVAGTAFFLIFVLAKIVRPSGAWTLFPMVIFILVLAFLMIGSNRGINIARETLPLSVSVPYNTSFEIAKESLKNNFFIGYGPAEYGYAFSKYLPKNFDNMGLRFFEGEGMIMESVPTLGTIGTVLLVVLILTFLGTSIFLLYREKEKNKIYSLGIMSASLVLLINVLVSQTEGFILIFLVMTATIATGSLLLESDVKEKFFNFSLKTSPKFALTLAFISLLIFASVAFLFVFFGKIYMADIYMGQAAKASLTSQENSIPTINKAIEFNGREGRYFTRLGQEYLSLTNQEMLKPESERDINKIQLYLGIGVQAGTRGKDLMKNDVTAVEALAQIYENSGIYISQGLDLAEQEYNRAVELEPNNPAFYVSLGRIKTKMAATKDKVDDKKKLVEEARDLFQKSIDIRNTYDSGYYNLALAQEALGQMDEAIDNMTKAVSLQRSNINYIFNLARLLQSRGKGDDNKLAENLFKQILGVNDKEINTHFNLGILYEKTDRKSEAITEYQKVIDLLPDGSDTTKSQLEKMINNIKKGVENTPETLGLTANSSNTANNGENSNPDNQVPASESNPASQPGQ